ncbi:MAG: hypothetical protein ACYCV4_02485 [Dermatophilaceae bacterium]
MDKALAWAKSHPLYVVGGLGALVLVYLYYRSRSSGGVTVPTSTGGTSTTVPSIYDPNGGGSGGGSTGTTSPYATAPPPTSPTTPTPVPPTTGTTIPPYTAPTTATAPSSYVAPSSDYVVPSSVSGTSIGSPIPVAAQAYIDRSNSGYTGEPVGYSPSQTTVQNSLAAAYYANPNSQAAQYAYDASIGYGPGSSGNGIGAK